MSLNLSMLYWNRCEPGSSALCIVCCVNSAVKWHDEVEEVGTECAKYETID